MPNQILVPSLGESVTEATVSKWLKQVGEKVESDEPLVELESDKVNLEIPSPAAGTLSSINVTEGNVVEVGALLGIINGGKSSSATTANKENAYQKPYVPPKTTEKKTTGKKINLKKQEALELVDVVGEESEDGDTSAVNFSNLCDLDGKTIKLNVAPQIFTKSMTTQLVCSNTEDFDVNAAPTVTPLKLDLYRNGKFSRVIKSTGTFTIDVQEGATYTAKFKGGESTIAVN